MSTQNSFNVAREKDDFLDVMLKYRCRILFTTRSRYENQISPEVKALPVDALIVLMRKFDDVEKKIDIIEELIAWLHGHAYAVELTAWLLSNGMRWTTGLSQVAQMCFIVFSCLAFELMYFAEFLLKKRHIGVILYFEL